MLVDLSKEELQYIVTTLWRCKKSESKCEDLYNKMKPLLEVCTCKETKKFGEKNDHVEPTVTTHGGEISETLMNGALSNYYNDVTNWFKL